MFRNALAAALLAAPAYAETPVPLSEALNSVEGTMVEISGTMHRLAGTQIRLEIADGYVPVILGLPGDALRSVEECLPANVTRSSCRVTGAAEMRIQTGRLELLLVELSEATPL